MSSSNNAHTALVVIDVQNAVVDGAFDRENIIGNMAALVDSARANNVPVIWVQHNDEDIIKGSEPWQIVTELQPAEGEVIVHKNFRSSFENTNLHDVLKQNNIETLVICGSQTEFCVRNTMHSAYEKGYNVTLVSDGHTTVDMDWNGVHVSAKSTIDEANLVYSHYQLPGRTVRAIPHTEIF